MRCGWRLFVLAVAVRVAAGATGPAPFFELAGEAAPIREEESAGGDFVLTQATLPVAPYSPDGALCFCGGPLFADGFESEDTSAWSAAFP